MQLYYIPSRFIPQVGLNVPQGIRRHLTITTLSHPSHSPSSFEYLWSLNILPQRVLAAMAWTAHNRGPLTVKTQVPIET